MEIIKIDPNNPDSKTIDRVVEVLENQGVIVYPTDTCYGLGADATNIFALNKLYKIKGRDYNKPVSIIAKDINAIKKFALVEADQEAFLKKYLPGEITAILLVTDMLNFKNNTVGVRIPNYKITKLIAEKFNAPYATTSANISGKPSCYNINDLLTQLKNQKDLPDLILDAGTLSENPPSTVVDIVKMPPRILRQGRIKINNRQSSDETRIV